MTDEILSDEDSSAKTKGSDKNLSEDLIVRTKLELLGQLYTELRSYRDKEFQTFIFAFTTIGIAYLYPLSHGINNEKEQEFLFIKMVLTAFAFLMLLYIYKNHRRMTKLKRIRQKLQDELNLSKYFKKEYKKTGEDIFPIERPTFSHLGTMIYLLVIGAEVLMLWFRIIPQRY